VTKRKGPALSDQPSPKHRANGYAESNAYRIWGTPREQFKARLPEPPEWFEPEWIEPVDEPPEGGAL
jgi:hypothetical protein